MQQPGTIKKLGRKETQLYSTTVGFFLHSPTVSKRLQNFVFWFGAGYYEFRIFGAGMHAIFHRKGLKWAQTIHSCIKLWFLFTKSSYSAANTSWQLFNKKVVILFLLFLSFLFFFENLNYAAGAKLRPWRPWESFLIFSLLVSQKCPSISFFILFITPL